ncbi:MAG TPA: 50S ribosomal protein L25 [Candidatus Magasanikbacteria bacterium]|jgi:large subunit ribosomal protein L25|nr:50S ribosomal protein L25 [Candidatus Magasanikbacteria bacterium]HQF57268.1 50S ribosomal protein L25 [Candidatus Magasanikbacteria bacterium]HQL52604.1 50S ribosomal protein L25 [Candidatus Magasanikbacteria bacterium]
MTVSFSVQKRDARAEEIRSQGKLPGVIYGSEMKPISIMADYNNFEKLLREVGESSLVDFKIEGGETVKALIQDVQYDPVKGRMIHFDLRQINMSQEIHAKVILNFVGEAPAVKEVGGTLFKGLEEVEIKCLPQDLVSEIEVDLSVLKTCEDAIHVKDLILPKGIQIISNLDTMVAKVTPNLTEEELKAMEEASVPSVEQVEVEKKGKEVKEEEKKEEPKK